MKTSAIPPLLRVSTKKKRSEFKHNINTTKHKEREKEREREREKRGLFQSLKIAKEDLRKRKEERICGVAFAIPTRPSWGIAR
mmetsp:Transcript_5466/g.18505  ORF Transcript_5466/g.18505 Transcript_5466/m.18505 type:complete len:83 (+) Transcript_5466:1504-1752(+)